MPRLREFSGDSLDYSYNSRRSASPGYCGKSLASRSSKDRLSPRFQLHGEKISWSTRNRNNSGSTSPIPGILRKSSSLSPARKTCATRGSSDSGDDAGRRSINPRYGTRRESVSPLRKSSPALHLSSVDSGHPSFARSISPPYEEQKSLCLNLSSFDSRRSSYGYGRSLSPRSGAGSKSVPRRTSPVNVDRSQLNQHGAKEKKSWVWDVPSNSGKCSTSHSLVQRDDKTRVCQSSNWTKSSESLSAIGRQTLLSDRRFSDIAESERENESYSSGLSGVKSTTSHLESTNKESLRWSTCSGSKENWNLMSSRKKDRDFNRSVSPVSSIVRRPLSPLSRMSQTSSRTACSQDATSNNGRRTWSTPGKILKGDWRATSASRCDGLSLEGCGSRSPDRGIKHSGRPLSAAGSEDRQSASPRLGSRERKLGYCGRTWASPSPDISEGRRSTSPRRRISGDSCLSSHHQRPETHVFNSVPEGPEPCDQHLDRNRIQYLFGTDGDGGLGGRSRFIPVTSLEDVQAVRCAEFHPSGKLYAVGSNSKTLRICAYPNLADLRDEHVTTQPNVLFKRTKHHKGSIYCLAWSPAGDLIATGSNDKTIKLMRFNSDSCNVEGDESELSMHDGTVRDVCFIEDMSNKSSLLVSGGAGDCRIWVTDCVTGTSFQSFTGHTGHILALYTWGGAMFVSGSQDRSVRFWDLRSRNCVNVMYPSEASTSSSSGGGGGGKGSPVASVVVDPSGRLMATGQEDSLCTLYDIRGARGIQSFRPHQSDVRSVRFSPSAFYLLTAGYDHRLVLTNMQGDLTAPLQCVPVAEHRDKVITGRWHPHEFSFVSTSADKMCTLWSMPPK